MRGTRVAVTLFFFADGLAFGSWAARIPAVRDQAGLTTPELGLALFAMSLGALLSMPPAGWLSERVGSRLVTVAGSVVGGASLFLASLASGRGDLAAALLAFGAAFGAINVSANAQGLALERLYGRSILSSFHAAFSAGGLAGAGVGALVAAAGIGPRAHFGVLALAVGLGALVTGRRLLPPEPGDARQAPILVRPPRVLLVLGAAAFFTLLAEGAAADWSAVYLADSLGATAGVAALGYTAFSLAMATSRTLGDRLNGRFGPSALARTGALVAATGLAVALSVALPAAALAGFAAMGAGLGVIVPVLFRAAGSTPGVSAGVGIAAVSTIGWLGFLSGPAAIGLAAGAVGLQAALVIVVVSVVTVALLSRAAAPVRGGEVAPDARRYAASRPGGRAAPAEPGSGATSSSARGRRPISPGNAWAASCTRSSDEEAGRSLELHDPAGVAERVAGVAHHEPPRQLVDAVERDDQHRLGAQRLAHGQPAAESARGLCGRRRRPGVRHAAGSSSSRRA